MAAFMEIYPESQPTLGVLNKLFAIGLDLLYLRHLSNNETIWKLILNKIDPAFHERIIVPVSVRQAMLEPKFIRHWKETERKQILPETLLPNNVYSTSIHFLPDIAYLDPSFRFVFYSPVFESISKVGYVPKHSLIELNRDLKILQQDKKDLPAIIALGGIKAKNIKQVKEVGFNGAALMGALWQSTDPVQAFEEIKNALEEG